MMEGVGRRWARFWMRFSGPGRVGRFACGVAGLFHPPFYGRVPLASVRHRGYFSPKATIHHDSLELGGDVFIGDEVLIYRDHEGGGVTLGTGVHLHRGTVIQTGAGGRVWIGEGTHIQPRCQISAYKGRIEIGYGVEIAPNCSFYSYDHEMKPGIPIGRQPLRSRGGIVIGNEVWLGVGVIVLDGVHIGDGSVVGAGSVVTSDIPEGSIAVGVPARVVKRRDEIY